MFPRPIARFDSLRCPSLVDTLHALAFRSPRRRVPRRRAGGFCFSRRFPPCGFVSKGNDRASHVSFEAQDKPGEPPVPRPCSATPAGRNASGLYNASTRPPYAPRRRLLASIVFRGSITRPGHSLSTLRRVGRPITTQDSLPATGQVLPDGSAHPKGSIERFQKMSPTSYPPFPSLVAQGASRFGWRKMPRGVILSAAVVTLSEAKGLYLRLGCFVSLILRFADSSLRSE